MVVSTVVIIGINSAIYMATAAAQGIFSWRLRLQKDARQLPPEKREFIEKKVAEVAKLYGIKKELKVTEIRRLSAGAQAMGNGFLPGRAGIAINPELFTNLTEGEQEFVIAHEISHIKWFDTFTIIGMAGVAFLTTSLALALLVPSMGAGPAILIGVVVATVTLCLFSVWREAAADKNAFLKCSDKGKAGGISFFEGIRQSNIAYRNSASSTIGNLWRKIRVSAEGENRFDLMHPSLKWRIKQLNQLAARPSPAQAPAA